MRASLNSKILVVVLVVVVVITAALSVLFYRAEREEVLTSAFARARSVGQTAEGALTAAMRSRDPEVVGHVVQGFERSGDVTEIQVYDADGQPAFGTGIEPAGELAKTVLSDRRARGAFEEDGVEPRYFAAEPVEISPTCYGCHAESDPIAGVILVEMSLQNEFVVLDGHRDRFILQTIVLVGALVLAIWVMLSRAVVRPLKVFARRARQIAGGDLAQRVDFRQDDEIGDLASSFNAMTAELAGRIGDLEEAKERLETSMHRVAEALSSALDINSIMHVMIGEAIGVARFTAGMVALEDGTSFVVYPEAEDPQGAEPSEGSGADDRLVALRRPLLGVADAVAGGGVARVLYRSADMGLDSLGLPEEFETLVVLPMSSEGEVVGHLMLVSRGHVEVTAPDRRALEFLASQGARAVTHSRLHDRAREMAITDGLTGLFDHRHFYESLGIEVGRAGRYGLSLSLVILDVDHFKSYNDRVGHRGGDQVLRRIGEVMRSQARGTDIIARYGGEEFAVVLPHTSHREALVFADRLRTAIEREPFLDSAGQPGGAVTVSLGVATRPEHAATAEGLVEAADRALYTAKTRGRNRVVSADALGEVGAPESVDARPGGR